MLLVQSQSKVYEMKGVKNKNLRNIIATWKRQPEIDFRLICSPRNL